MTHNDIKTKFMIEYDKANVTSSYPSLTNYEIAVILNKAYLALIAQKVTGNNVRRAPFEADTKAISDVQELIVSTELNLNNPAKHITAENSACYTIPQNFLYYVSGMVKLSGHDATVMLLPHEIAGNFKQTAVNRPWIKNSVCYIEGDTIVVLYDNYDNDDPGTDPKVPGKFTITYIKQPASFTASFSGTFELNDTMAEELITLAVTFALENVESTRLQSQVQMRGLEA